MFLWREVVELKDLCGFSIEGMTLSFSLERLMIFTLGNMMISMLETMLISTLGMTLPTTSMLEMILTLSTRGRMTLTCSPGHTLMMRCKELLSHLVLLGCDRFGIVCSCRWNLRKGFWSDAGGNIIWNPHLVMYFNHHAGFHMTFFQYPECARCRKYSEGYVGADCCAMLKTDYLFHVDRAKRRDDVMHPLVEKI